MAMTLTTYCSQYIIILLWPEDKGIGAPRRLRRRSAGRHVCMIYQAKCRGEAKGGARSRRRRRCDRMDWAQRYETKRNTLLMRRLPFREARKRASKLLPIIIKNTCRHEHDQGGSSNDLLSIYMLCTHYHIEGEQQTRPS